MKQRMTPDQFRHYSHMLWHTAAERTDDHTMVFAFVLTHSWMALHHSSWIEIDQLLDEMIGLTGLEFAPEARIEFTHIYIGQAAVDEIRAAMAKEMPDGFAEVADRLIAVEGDAVANEFMEAMLGKRSNYSDSDQEKVDQALRALGTQYSRNAKDGTVAHMGGRKGIEFYEKLGSDTIDRLVDEATGELGSIEKMVGKWAEGLE